MVDAAVYSRNRCFRVLFSFKFGKGRALVPELGFDPGQAPAFHLVESLVSFVQEDIELRSGGMMSWFSNWWKTDATQTFIKLVVKAMRLWLGSIVDTLWIISQEEVRKVEDEQGTLSGHEKAIAVLSNVRARLGSTKVRTMYLKLLIEAAVIVLKKPQV